MGGIFFSGQYRSKTLQRQLGVSRICNRIKFRELHQAMENQKIQSIDLTINGVPHKGFSREKSLLRLAEPLGRGNYYVILKITYCDLDKPVRF